MSTKVVGGWAKSLGWAVELLERLINFFPQDFEKRQSLGATDITLNPCLLKTTAEPIVVHIVFVHECDSQLVYEYVHYIAKAILCFVNRSMCNTT